jgi:hypothetical protein
MLINITMCEEVNFNLLKISIPNNIKLLSIEKQSEIFNYLNELDEHNLKAYSIAFKHLESSFDIYRSVGFKNWKKSNSKSNTS